MKAPRSALLALFAACGLIAAGCASSDLSKDTDTTQQVVECLPVDTPAPTVVARAIWFPHASGFGSTDASPLGHASGVLALAGGKLWFMAWNNEEKHFDMLRDLSVVTAIGARADRLGPSALLVVESRDRSFDAFELMKKGHVTSDPEGTQALLAQIQALRKNQPDGGGAP